MKYCKRAIMLLLWLFVSRLNIPRNFIHSSLRVFLKILCCPAYPPPLELCLINAFLNVVKSGLWKTQDLQVQWYYWSSLHPRPCHPWPHFQQRKFTTGLRNPGFWNEYTVSPRDYCKGKTLIVMNRISIYINVISSL